MYEKCNFIIFILYSMFSRLQIFLICYNIYGLQHNFIVEPDNKIKMSVQVLAHIQSIAKDALE